MGIIFWGVLGGWIGGSGGWVERWRGAEGGCISRQHERVRATGGGGEEGEVSGCSNGVVQQRSRASEGWVREPGEGWNEGRLWVGSAIQLAKVARPHASSESHTEKRRAGRRLAAGGCR